MSERRGWVKKWRVECGVDSDGLPKKERTKLARVTEKRRNEDKKREVWNKQEKRREKEGRCEVIGKVRKDKRGVNREREGNVREAWHE